MSGIHTDCGARGWLRWVFVEIKINKQNLPFFARHIANERAICRNPPIHSFTEHRKHLIDHLIDQCLNTCFYENIRRSNFFCGCEILTESVFVTELSSKVGISDELCVLWQIAVTWAIWFRSLSTSQYTCLEAKTLKGNNNTQIIKMHFNGVILRRVMVKEACNVIKKLPKHLLITFTVHTDGQTWNVISWHLRVLNIRSVVGKRKVHCILNTMCCYKTNSF